MHNQISFVTLALVFAGSAMSAPVSNTSITATAISSVVDQQSSTDVPFPSLASTPAETCTPTTPDPALFTQLLLAPDAVARLALLSEDDLVFNFVDPCLTANSAGVVAGEGGRTVRADHATFPALVSSGGSITMGFLGPCGFNTPHVHPRATQLNVVVEGSLFTSFTAENGAKHMNRTLNKYEMTVFPQGAIHTEANFDCTDAVFVAAFPDEDPGVGQVAQEFFGFEDELITAALGGEITVDGRDLDAFRNLIPANVALGVESCLAKCGIAKR